MRYIVIYISIILFCLGCTQKEELITHPEPCFFSYEVDNCQDLNMSPLDILSNNTLIGMPKLDDSTRPFVIELSAPVDDFMVMDHTVAVFEGDQKLTRPNDFNYVFNRNQQQIVISPVNEHWKAGALYTVVMTKQVVSQDKVSFKRPAIFELLCNSAQLRDQAGNLLPGLTEKLEQWITTQRPVIQKKLQPIADQLRVRTDDIILMWQYKFSEPTVCFKENNIENCQEHPYPVPSNYLYDTLPEGLAPDISRDQGVVIHFSETPELRSILSHIEIYELQEDEATLQQQSLFDITFLNDQNRAISILPKTGLWELGKKYRILLKKGVVNKDEIPFAPSRSFFLMGQEISLLDITELTELLTSEELAESEALRIRYQPELAKLNTETLLLSLEISFGNTFLLPCLLEGNYSEGCKEVAEYPIPSDHYLNEKNGVTTVAIPIEDRFSLPLAYLLEQVNKLDGWSVSMPFSIYLSKDGVKEQIEQAVKVYAIEESGLVEAIIKPIYNSEHRLLEIYPETLWSEGKEYIVVLKGNDTTGMTIKRPMLSRLIFFEESLVDDQNRSRFPGISDQLAQLGEAEKLRYAPLKQHLIDYGIPLDSIAALWPITIRKPTEMIRNLNNGLGNYTPDALFPEETTTLVTQTELIAQYPYYNWEHTRSLVKTFVDMPNLVIGIDHIFNDALYTRIKDGTPLKTQDLTSVPVKLILPQGDKIKGVVIFLHEYLRHWGDILGIVDHFTEAGYVVAAFDYQYHGQRVNQGSLADLKDNITGETQPDGVTDRSGEGFFTIDLSKTQYTMIQTVVEQVWLINLLKNLDFGAAFDVTPWEGDQTHTISLVGHGIGGNFAGIIGGINHDISQVVFNNSGALFSEVLSGDSKLSQDIAKLIGEQFIIDANFEGNLMRYSLQNLFDDVDQYSFRGETPDVLLQSGENDPFFLPAAQNALKKRWGVDTTTYVGDSTSKYWHYFTFLTTSQVAADAIDEIIDFLTGA